MAHDVLAARAFVNCIRSKSVPSPLHVAMSFYSVSIVKV